MGELQGFYWSRDMGSDIGYWLSCIPKTDTSRNIPFLVISIGLLYFETFNNDTDTFKGKMIHMNF